MTSPTRRHFLAAATAGTLAAVSGCLGGSATPGSQATTDQQSTSGHDVQSSFFVAGDIAHHVAGEKATVSDLVPFGQHGHGWEPGPRIQRAVFDADAFVYVGKGFQPWADDIVANLATDAPDLPVVAVREGIDLLPAPESGGNEDRHDGEEDHKEDDHKEDDHKEEGHDNHENDEGHDHGASDPHFWLDPQRAKQAAVNVRDAFADFDPESEATYEANAELFAAELDALDTEFEETLADRDRDVVLVAGHNAFQYLGERYGFEVHALVGIAPDATPSPQAIREAQEVIDRHGIEHILTPVFESDRAATQLVEETDATETLPLTPIPTLTAEWAEQGWGYLDVMREVNLDSLATALGRKMTGTGFESENTVASFDDVTFGYGPTPVVEDVSFTVEPGDFLALVGPNGSGKSTLLRLLLGLHRPDSGSVRLFGEPAHETATGTRVGYVAQDVAGTERAMPITVREVVRMGRYPHVPHGRFRPEDREAVDQALATVDVADLAKRRVGELSGGQRQRVFIARALATGADVLALDEPTVGVDARSREAFFDLLSTLNREGLTVVLVEHDIGVVTTHASRVACLNRQLHFHGSTADFVESDALSAAYGANHHVVVHDHGGEAGGTAHGEGNGQ